MIGNAVVEEEEVMGGHRPELSSKEQTAFLILASVQLSLAATAWADLAVRPATEVNGRKAIWAALIAINFVGPLAYFRWGRLTSAAL